MSKDPAVLFYTSDFLSGTYELTYEQRGKYITLLCVQHQKPENEIPKAFFESIIQSCDEVYQKFIKTDTGYYNQRMREESLKRKSFCDSRRKSIEKRYVRTTNEVHTDVRMENENEDVNNNGIGISIKGGCKGETKQEEKNWRNDYETYRKECEAEFDKLFNNYKWIATMREFHPGVKIQTSLEKMFMQYWGAQIGWKKKKSQRSKDLDWKATIENTFKYHRVFLAKGEQDIEGSLLRAKGLIP